MISTKTQTGKRLLARLLILSATLAPAAQAAHVACNSTVSNIAMNGLGEVYAVLAGKTDIHSICNVRVQGAFVATPEACKAIYSSLVSAKLSGQRVTLYYGDLPSCSSITGWMQATTFYHASMD